MNVQLVCHYLARGNWIGMKDRKRSREKLKGSRKATSIIRGFTGSDYTHVYSHC